MKLKDLEERTEGDSSNLEINYNLVGLEPQKRFIIVKGEDFTLSAEKTESTGGIVYWLDYNGKDDIVGYLDPEEYEQLEEELKELEESQKRGDISERGVKPRVHVHKRPRCRDTGKPAYCGHRRCFNGVAMHVACINIPFSSKKMCTCVGVS